MTTQTEALKMALEALENMHIVDFPIEDLCNWNKAITAIKKALAQPEQERCVGCEACIDTACGRDECPNGWPKAAQPEQEPVALPEGKKLILVDSSFDDLMYWLERCERKGHLENCADLIEPWEKFDYRDFTHPPVPTAQPKEPEQEPVAMPRFNCWSTNDGDSWFDDPADANVIYDTLGDEPQIGDEFEIIAGWKSVTAKYRVTKVGVDGDCEVECISHPQENTTPPQRKPLTDERLDDIYYCVEGWATALETWRQQARAIEAAHGIKE